MARQCKRAKRRAKAKRVEQFGQLTLLVTSGMATVIGTFRVVHGHKVAYTTDATRAGVMVRSVLYLDTPNSRVTILRTNDIPVCFGEYLYNKEQNARALETFINTMHHELELLLLKHNHKGITHA